MALRGLKLCRTWSKSPFEKLVVSMIPKFSCGTHFAAEESTLLSRSFIPISQIRASRNGSTSLFAYFKRLCGMVAVTDVAEFLDYSQLAHFIGSKRLEKSRSYRNMILVSQNVSTLRPFAKLSQCDLGTYGYSNSCAPIHTPKSTSSCSFWKKCIHGKPEVEPNIIVAYKKIMLEFIVL